MADFFDEIPDRDVFKASEVCEIAKIQPYVLRSWEQEFQNLGVARAAGGPRAYRRGDVERVLRIKQLVFGEGLTLAGARRRLDGDTPRPAEEALPALVDDQARAQLAGIRQGLRALLELLDRTPRDTEAGQQQTLPELAGGGDAELSWPPKGKSVGGKSTGRKRPPKAV